MRRSEAELNEGDRIPELRVTPDKYLPHRYAGASGDFNPIHIDNDFAQMVGLPRNILHGLYSMAQVARAQTEAAGSDPRALRRLKVQFRGMGVPEEEIVVTGTVRERDGDRVVIDTEAVQAGNGIVRNAEAEFELRPLRQVAIAVVALLLGLVALPVIGAASEISDEPTCSDVNAGVAIPDAGEQCFDGSTLRRAAVVGLMAVSAVTALGAMLIGVAAAIRGTSGVLFAITAMAAVGVFFGAYGAARF